jgi:hypothetical protein
MHDYAGNYYPRLAAANSGRRFFVTADILETMPQERVAPFGTGFELFHDPASASRARERIPPLPALRLRGGTDAMHWDLRSFRAWESVGAAYAIQGVRLLAKRRYEEAEAALRVACRLPLAHEALASVRYKLIQARLAKGALSRGPRQ